MNKYLSFELNLCTHENEHNLYYINRTNEYIMCNRIN